MNEALSTLAGLLADNRRGQGTGVVSICSAHPVVLEACLRAALEEGSVLLVESTSNQVDQYGGYTGMKPADFAAFVRRAAREHVFPEERLLLGGDHLGPNRWRGLPAEEAMGRAEELVRAYVRAGYRKIHLDASMHLTGDPAHGPGGVHAPLPDEVVAERAARLCAAAEAAASEAGAAKGGGRAPAAPGARPVYVIGTEVPVPGGAVETEETLRPTRVEDVQRTVEVTREAFRRRGLEEAWQRVAAVVVQPGVEFGNDFVFDYERRQAAPLSRWVEGVERLVFEAHSTDYQTRGALRQMVEDHFCILKVGPALTFAFREAVFALDAMEREWLGESDHRAELRRALDRVMLENPEHWKSHVPDDPLAGGQRRQAARLFGYSDRSRYYWPHPDLAAPLERLLANLSGATGGRAVPLTLLSQYLPRQYRAVREGALAAEPRAWVLDKVGEVLADYAAAVRAKTGGA